MTAIRTRRRGTALLEILVALPLIALLGTLGVALLLATARQGTDVDTRLGGARELRHASHTLAAELRPLSSDDIVAWTDTSIEFHALLGAGVACGTRGALDAVTITDALELAPAWRGTPGAGDVVRVATTTATLGAPAITVARDIAEVRSTAACATAPPALRSARATTLLVASPLPAQVAEGSAVRITQRARYSLYRASDGLWFLGRRAWAGAAWDVVQPVAGPLHTPTRAGLRIRALDSLGTPLPIGSPGSRVRGFAVELRAPRGITGARTDSLALRLSIRSGRAP